MIDHQLEVLNVFDRAKTQLYHFTAVVVTGIGFFTDSYDLFCISLVTKLLSRIYYTVDGSSRPGTLPPFVVANGVALCGTLAGQLFFGWLDDKLDWKCVYGLTLILMVICCIASGLSPSAALQQLTFPPYVSSAFGIGGDYPLSATIMAEYSNQKMRGAFKYQKMRGAFIVVVFVMLGFGILAGGATTIVISTIFKTVFSAPSYVVDPVNSTIPQADYVGRIILMVGALPTLLTYYWRMKMPETSRYTTLVAKDEKKARDDMSKVLNVKIVIEQCTEIKTNSFGLFSKTFMRRHGLHLLGTASTWFLIDVAYYSPNLFQKDISIGSMSALEEVFKIAKAQTLISLCGTIPSYWVTVLFIDRVGRFFIQVVGFFIMTVFMFALAIPYHHWTGNHAGFIVMYGLTFFFANFGPNCTTFIVPTEIFPARFRSTCHGISAAAGKALKFIFNYKLI